ncbi:hypothetical protein [Ornithinimicrobium kibberense]|uniref:hypothetical protein n=1 Tax=Ornithinimicrobium kibberense TaxID=282060 RepID=UPI003621AE51
MFRLPPILPWNWERAARTWATLPLWGISGTFMSGRQARLALWTGCRGSCGSCTYSVGPS